MQVSLTERFRHDFDQLPHKAQQQTIAVIAQLPKAMGAPHRHVGIGLRKLHASGIYEARLGLGLRMIFAVKKQSLLLHRIGTHDQIRRYLKALS